MNKMPIGLIVILGTYTLGYFAPDILGIIFLFFLLGALSFAGYIYYKFWYILARKVWEYKD